jgi:hypothetical protein
MGDPSSLHVLTPLCLKHSPGKILFQQNLEMEPNKHGRRRIRDAAAINISSMSWNGFGAFGRAVKGVYVPPE